VEAEVDVRPWRPGVTGFVERVDGPVARRHLPGPALVAVIDLDGTISMEGEATRPGGFVAGVAVAPRTSHHPGSQRCIEVRIDPLRAPAVLGVSAAELTGATTALHDLVPEVVERCHAARAWDGAFAVVDGWLAASSTRTVDPLAAELWRRIVVSGGSIALTAAAADLGVERRSMAARFERAIGLTPKAAARLVRFAAATAAIDHGTDGLAAVAASCGYADQSHLHRDFVAFGSITPGAYAGERLAELRRASECAVVSA
jgi:AraC-like DNA-binding protein